jgi:hypothetical protein
MKKKRINARPRKARPQVVPLHIGSAKRSASREGKKLVGGHFDPDIARKLKLLAAENDTSCQRLLEEALIDLFQKYDRQKRGY